MDLRARERGAGLPPQCTACGGAPASCPTIERERPYNRAHTGPLARAARWGCERRRERGTSAHARGRSHRLSSRALALARDAAGGVRRARHCGALRAVGYTARSAGGAGGGATCAGGARRQRDHPSQNGGAAAAGCRRAECVASAGGGEHDRARGVRGGGAPGRPQHGCAGAAPGAGGAVRMGGWAAHAGAGRRRRGACRPGRGTAGRRGGDGRGATGGGCARGARGAGPRARPRSRRDRRPDGCTGRRARPRQYHAGWHARSGGVTAAARAVAATFARFVRIRSRALGLRAQGGLPMLLYQGALAFALWTGREPPLDAMRAALAP